MASELADRCDVLWLLGVGMEGEVLWDLPDEDFPIVGCGSDDTVVEGVPGRMVSSSPLRRCIYCTDRLGLLTSRCLERARYGL